MLGSSLTVMSGLRFVHRAAAAGIPVAIVNQGTTRGDGYADSRRELDGPAEARRRWQELNRDAGQLSRSASCSRSAARSASSAATRCSSADTCAAVAAGGDGGR